MAVDRRTLRLIDGMRVQIGAAVDAEVEQLTLAWARAWSELQREWSSAIADLAASGSGSWPSRRQIGRAVRVKAALEATEAAIDELGRNHQVRILRDLPSITEQAAEWERRITAAQYPSSLDAAQVAATLEHVSPRALEAIVRRTTEQITALTRPLSQQATAAMKSTLIRGVALGLHPNRAASIMVRRVAGDFEGGLTRAKVIARTEMLDAHRAAAHAQNAANADVLSGWQWICTLDRRTCDSCLAQHGSVHDLDEEGPEDHQQGRCARIPLLKPWKDLGIDLDEPPSLVPDAREWFDNQSVEDQESIMGKARLDLLRSGAVTWDDLSTKRRTDGWRDSWAPTSLATLQRIAAGA